MTVTLTPAQQEILNALKNGFVGDIEKRFSDWGPYQHASLANATEYVNVKIQTVQALAKKGLIKIENGVFTLTALEATA
jgi:hypothetical protein